MQDDERRRKKYPSTVLGLHWLQLPTYFYEALPMSCDHGLALALALDAISATLRKVRTGFRLHVMWSKSRNRQPATGIPHPASCISHLLPYQPEMHIALPS